MDSKNNQQHRHRYKEGNDQEEGGKQRQTRSMMALAKAQVGDRLWIAGYESKDGINRLVGMGLAMSKRFDGGVGAFAYLLFVLMYFPCVAATGAVYRETNLGWTMLVALWTTGLGYWVATMFYQIVTFPQHPGFSVAWIIGGAVIMAATIFLLKGSGSPQEVGTNRDGRESRQLTH